MSQEAIDRLNQDSYLAPDGCQIWTGRLNEDGYGVLYWDMKDRKAHRVSWFAHNGEIPDMPVHHKCSVRNCINIDHLQVVSVEHNLAEMFERNNYISKIAALEAENEALKMRLLNGE